ncbi:MAG: ATP-grasp domain-containing protein, partial [Acinetobacter pittii]
IPVFLDSNYNVIYPAILWCDQRTAKECEEINEIVGKEKIFEISKKACKILNLKGYIGIDFVIKDKIYLIEINPRITTSAIALQKSSNANIAKLHLQCFNDKELKELNLKFSKTVSFYKYKNYLKFYTVPLCKQKQ